MMSPAIPSCSRRQKPFDFPTGFFSGSCVREAVYEDMPGPDHFPRKPVQNLPGNRRASPDFLTQKELVFKKFLAFIY
jgi:hypothetical protein